MASDFRICSRAYGIHSSRYAAAAVFSTSVAVPLSGEVIIYSLADLSVHNRFKVSDDSLMVLLAYGCDLICMSYSGLVAVYTVEGQRKAHTKTSERTVRHGAVSNDRQFVCACGEFGAANGTIDVWRLTESEFVPVWRAVGNYRFCEFSPSNRLFAMRETVVEGDSSSFYSKDQPISAENSLADFPPESQVDPIDVEARRASRKETRMSQYYACSFSLSSSSDRSCLLLPTVSYINCCANNHEGMVAALYLDRTLVVIDIDRMEIVQRTQMAGAGAIIAFTFRSNCIYLSPAQRVLTEITVNSALSSLVEVTSPTEAGIVATKTTFSCLNKGLYHISWVDFPHKLLICEENGLFLCDLPSYSAAEPAGILSKTGHSTTCCGVGINSAETFLCSCDFSGQIFTWSLTNQANEPVSIHSVVRTIQGLPIRSLVWAPNGEFILVGTMMGNVYRVNRPWEATEQPEEVFAGEHTVVCMAWKGDKLALGTTRGELQIFQSEPSGLTPVLSLQAHLPSTQPADCRFGSLPLYSEIWTLSWSPSTDRLLATGSEDQTVVVWDLSTLAKVVTLPKHRNAVTGVAWQTVAVPDSMEILASCSDDQQLRVYETEKWTILHTFRTTFICEWHTLTYLAVEERGSRVMVVSQNGYLFVYSLIERVCLFGEKVHSGSVEGLTWTGDLAATVSSDCSILTICTSQSVGSALYAKI